MQFVNVFDLDGTLIDSSHRINKNGDIDEGLDLEYWKNNCNAISITKDKLLPLVDVYHEFGKTGFINIAVTARDMNQADYDYLHNNGMFFNMILHREDSIELDHILKERKLSELFKDKKLKPFLAFDDKEENLEVFKKFGFTTINALQINKLMKTH